MPIKSATSEEDEGFGDWSHQKKQQMQELKQEGEDISEKVIMIDKTTESLSSCQHRPGQNEENWSEGETEKSKEEKEEGILCQSVRRKEVEREEAMTRRMENVQRSDSEVRALLQIIPFKV